MARCWSRVNGSVKFLLLTKAKHINITNLFVFLAPKGETPLDFLRHTTLRSTAIVSPTSPPVTLSNLSEMPFGLTIGTERASALQQAIQDELIKRDYSAEAG